MGGEALRTLVVSPALREEFLRLSTSISREPSGKILFQCGDTPRGLYLVCSGKVSLMLETGNIAFPPRIAGPGAVVGLPATMAGSPYSLTAEVIEEAEVAFVSARSYAQLAWHRIRSFVLR